MNEPAAPPHQKRRQYLLGLGLGLIPLLVFLVATGFSYQARSESSRWGVALVVLLISPLLYVVVLFAMIVYLGNRQDRFVGYGLLTAVLTSPIIGAIACVVTFTIH